MIKIEYPDGYFEKQQTELTFGKHVYSDTEHPRTADGRWRPAPGSHHGQADGPHNAGPSGGGRKAPAKEPPKPAEPEKPKEPEAPKPDANADRIAAGAKRVKDAGPIPDVRKRTDYPKAVEYFKKLGTELDIKDGVKPDEIRIAMNATKDFVEQTGYSPKKLTMSTYKWVKQNYGGRLARSAAAFYDSDVNSTFAHRTSYLAPHTTKVGGYTIGNGKTDHATGAFWHEFGHDIDYNHGTGNARNDRRGNVANFGYSLQELQSQGMSRYGLTKRNEFVAEYVGGYMQGVKFGPAVHETYIKMGGPPLGGKTT